MGKKKTDKNTIYGAIIIEGCDCSGKTTLCKKLQERYTNIVSVVHDTYNDPSDYHFYREQARKTNTIYDRHFIGEYVYPQVYHRQAKLSEFDKIRLCADIDEYNCLVFVLAPSDETIKNRLLAERADEEQEVKDDYTKINSAFRTLGQELSKMSKNIYCIEFIEDTPYEKIFDIIDTKYGE